MADDLYQLQFVQIFIAYNVAQSLYFCIMSAHVANLLHGGCMMLFCSVLAVTIALLPVVHCCFTSFYSVPTPRKPRFTPCYIALLLALLPLPSSLLSAFSLWFTVILCLFCRYLVPILHPFPCYFSLLHVE